MYRNYRKFDLRIPDNTIFKNTNNIEQCRKVCEKSKQLEKEENRKPTLECIPKSA